MNISSTFIERPIATSLLMAAIALFGSVAYRSLPVSDLPNVDLPTLLVTAGLPGASPETMAAAVATPLENNFSMIAGLESMTSTNSLGSTQITLEFDLSRKLDGAAVDVQAAITQSARLLPAGPTPRHTPARRLPREIASSRRGLRRLQSSNTVSLLFRCVHASGGKRESSARFSRASLRRTKNVGLAFVAP